MKNSTKEILVNLLTENPMLASVENQILQAFEFLYQCNKSGGKILVCGNGGSAADADHIVGELMKGFALERRVTEEQQKESSLEPEILQKLQLCIPAISLSAHSALFTAFCNDESPDMVFAQQVFGYMKKEDVLICISTSGNSKNVVNAAKVAKSLQAKTIALTGSKGGKLLEICDATICANNDCTYKIQQLHLPIYHGLCLMLENEFFGK